MNNKYQVNKHGYEVGQQVMIIEDIPYGIEPHKLVYGGRYRFISHLARKKDVVAVLKTLDDNVIELYSGYVFRTTTDFIAPIKECNNHELCLPIKYATNQCPLCLAESKLNDK